VRDATPFHLRHGIAGVLIGALLIGVPQRASAQVTDLDIWIDTDGDGLPGPSRGNFVASGIADSFAVYIDSHDFAWTNFLCYLSLGDPAAPGFFLSDSLNVQVRYGVSGGLFLPEDDFSLPNTVGIGGIGFAERSGVVHLASVTLRTRFGAISGFNGACVRPIVTPDNDASVLSVLGNGSAYGLFDAGQVTGACYTIYPLDGNPVRVTISPEEPFVLAGDSIQFNARGEYWEGDTADFTRVIEWRSSDPVVATIDSNGVARGVAPGAAMIHATGDPIRDSTLIFVGDALPRLVALEVAPAETTLAAGFVTSLSAIGSYDVLPPRDLSARVTWSVSDTTIATVSPAGIARARAPGVASVRATMDGIFGEMALTVTEAELVSLGIDPPSASVPLGMTYSFLAEGVYTDGSIRDATRGTSWSADNEDVATIGSDGVARAEALGTTLIAARRGERSATATLLVVDALLVSTPVAPWFVGAPESVYWSGPGIVDIDLTADDGATYVALARDVPASPLAIRAPRGSSNAARLRVSIRLEGTVFSVESDPFPIASEIALTAIDVGETEDGRVHMRWTTDPAPPLIVGYRIERAVPGEEFAPLGGMIATTSFLDEFPVAGAEYRLIALNGFLDETVLATRSVGSVLLGRRSLVVFPNPAARGDATVLFRVPDFAAGERASARTTASIFDVAGRHVRTLFDGVLAPGVRELRWDGLASDGAPVAPGLYFVRIRSELAPSTSARLVVVR